MRGLVIRCGVVVCLAVLASAASAATAAAARLSVTVAPTTVHPNGTYTITIAGRYPTRSLQTTPSLLAFIQYTGSACRRTATAEYALPTREWNWVFYPQRSERHTPFRVVFHEQARTRFGERRVCAYLYPRAIVPASTDKPLVIASAAYQDVKG